MKADKQNIVINHVNGRNLGKQFIQIAHFRENNATGHKWDATFGG